MAVNEDVCQFNISDPDFSTKSEEVHEAREKCWYAKSNLGLIALRYEEVRNALRDKRLRQGVYAWPEQNGITEGPLTEWWKHNPLCLEGEDHRRVRRLLNPAFAPKSIDTMAEGFAEVANELIDEFAGRGECEFMNEFAAPFSTRVLMRLLGLPDDQWKRVADLATDMGDSFSVEIATELPKIEAALAGLYEMADEAIADSRSNGGSTFVADLVAARDGEDKLTEDELRALLVTFIFAGMDTTRNQLGFALMTFIKHPEQWRLLGDQPELAAAAVEEVMRVDPTVLWITREATEDLEINDTPIPAGTTLHVFTEPANTDPRAGASDTFDITAENPRQLGFGAGPHHCVGHYFTRVDMREALVALAKRIKNPRHAGEPKVRPESGVSGPLELPLAFDPEVSA